jgi:hypothetical protein
MINRRSFIVACCATFLAPPALAADDDPAAPVTAIYERGSGGNHGGQFVWLKKKDRARWMSRGLAAAWNKADAKTKKGDQKPLGFDPISNSQDPMIRAAQVVVKRRDANTAIVAASFVGWGEAPHRQTVLYDMVREKSRWAIEDIRGATDGKDWSIRRLLAEWK